MRRNEQARDRKAASEGRRRSNRARARRREARGARRVRARRFVRGARYKITKRCLERRFFMVPDSTEVTEIIGYCLGLCCSRFSIELHAACFMSNHYHLDVTDVNGELPAFKCMLNGLLARALNCHRGRFDKFWSADRACDVELLEDEDTLDGMAYTVANPTEALLVRRAIRWEGLTTAGKPFGTKMKFERPACFFDAHNDDMPEEVELEIKRPNVKMDLSDAELYDALMERCRERELGAARKARKEHRRFLGEQRVRRQKWHRWPKNHEDRFTPTPKISSRSKWARIAATQRNREWERQYGLAYEARLRGEDVEFPYGTYALRRFAGARVAGPP